MMHHEQCQDAKNHAQELQEAKTLRCFVVELNNVGVGLYNRDDHATAIEMFNEALETMSAIRPKGQNKPKNPLELMQRNLDKVNLGTEKLAESLRSSCNVHVRIEEDRINMNQTRTISEALYISQPSCTMIKKTRESSIESVYYDESAVILFNLSIVFLKMGESNMARVLLETALSTSHIEDIDHSGGSLLYASILNNLGHIYYCSGQYEDATEALSKAFSLVCEYKSSCSRRTASLGGRLCKEYHNYLATMFFNNGCVHSKKHEHNKALQNYSAALFHMEKELFNGDFKQSLWVAVNLYIVVHTNEKTNASAA